MEKDYSKLDEVIVTSQEEMDDIPDNYKGKIIIKAAKRVVVRKRYYYPVVALGNSSVVALGNSSVVARGNVQVVDCLKNGKIQVFGNARIVCNPKTIHEFMNFYEIKHTETKAILYKAVRKVDDEYVSDYDDEFIYEVGKTYNEKCDDDISESCSYGLHISHLNWALDFGQTWDNLAILEVETPIISIVLPNGSDGQVRTSNLQVLREVPLEECGLYGKILAKRRARQ